MGCKVVKLKCCCLKCFSNCGSCRLVQQVVTIVVTGTMFDSWWLQVLCQFWLTSVLPCFCVIKRSWSNRASNVSLRCTRRPHVRLIDNILPVYVTDLVRECNLYGRHWGWYVLVETGQGMRWYWEKKVILNYLVFVPGGPLAANEALSEFACESVNYRDLSDHQVSSVLRLWYGATIKSMKRSWSYSSQI